jgi:hypothetical protein
MWKRVPILVVTVSFLTLTASAHAHCPCATRSDPRFPPVEPLAISLPHFALGPNERVASFRCEVSEPSGFLRVNTPYLWEMNIVNGSGNAAKLTADAIEGEDELANKDLAYFNDFVVVGKPKKAPVMMFGSYSPFDIDVELTIAGGPELNKSRTLKFSMKELIIKPVQ